MPPVVATVIGLIELYGVFTVVAYAVTLASVAYSAYMMATMEAPNQPDATKRLQTVRSSIQPHRVLYGECMTSGVLVYAQTHSINPATGESEDGENKYISLVVAFTGHEVEEIKEIWLNDKLSTDSVFIKHIEAVDAEGYWLSYLDGPEMVWVETKPAIPAHDETFATMFKYTGTSTQTANSFLISLPPKPTTVIAKNPTSGLNDLSIGGEYSVVGMAVFKITIVSTGEVDQFSWSNEHEYSGSNIPITGIEQTLSNGIKIKFDAVTGHSVGQAWEVRAFDGAPWTSDCRLQGCSYVVAILEYSDKAFPTGLPNVKALIKGNNQIYDPRTGLTGYSDNWALCVRDYLTKPYGLNAPISDINETTAIAAANICDEEIELLNGTQKRYTINGSFTLDKTPTAIMNEILATAYGAITWTQGQYRILPASFYTPDLTFHGMNAGVSGLTESDLRGQLKVRPAPSLKDKFNAVKGTYVSPETWQMVDFPKVKNDFYQDQDGYEIVKDVQLTYVTDSVRAQRIAKIMLEKSRQGIMVDFPAKWSAFPLAVGDVVPITIAKLGWDQKLFTVRDWKMHSEGGVDLSLQEEAEECYDWNFGEETTTDLAQDTLLPDPRYVPLVTGLEVGEELYATNVGSIVKSRAILTWNNMGLRQYEANYKPSNNTIWTPLPLTLDTTCVVDDTIPGTYNFRVRGMNFLGVWGDWSTISYLVKGKLAPPPNVDSFLITPQQDGTRTLSWLMHNAPLDLAGWRIKFRRGTDAGLWSTMTALHTGLLLSSPFETNQLSAGDYVFGIVAVDTTGNESLNPLYIQTTLPDPRMTNVWASSLNMDGDWPGIKTDCYINGVGELEANDTSTWNSIPATWAEWARWNFAPVSSFTYETQSIDIGHSIMFTPQVTAFGVGSISVEMTTSSDNSSWGAWSALEKTQARYVKFKASASGASPLILSLSELSVYIIVKPVIEEVGDLLTSSLTGSYRIGVGDVRIPLTGDYTILNQVSITLQNVGPGWSWQLIDKDVSLGPRIKIFNGLAAADCTIDAYIKGV